MWKYVSPVNLRLTGLFFYHYAALGIIIAVVAIGELTNTVIIVMIIALVRVLLISIYHKAYLKLAL